MKRTIDIDLILSPIPGDNPAGENLRYTPVYDKIKEDRIEEDLLEQGEWQREIKTADWDKVISTSVEALLQKSKDLQIAAWLMEALVKTEAFEGMAAGLKILNGFLRDFWDCVYPEIEEEDLDFRAAPLEFINDKLWLSVKQIPLTDKSVTPGYSWLKWQESRQVGYEKDILNAYGDVDPTKKNTREELISEGKITGENFDSAVSLSSRAFYESLAQSLTECRELFQQLDQIIDEKFGAAHAPRLSDLNKALEDCDQIVNRILKEKRAQEPEPEPAAETEPPPETEVVPTVEEMPETETALRTRPITELPEASTRGYAELTALEKTAWEQALAMLKSSGIKNALERLLAVSCSAPSIREKNRCRLLMAKLCLEAKRPDLAKPIIEELYALIEELHLERWESAIWIAEVLDTLYRCLTTGEEADQYQSRAEELFQKLCTTDVTKAMKYRQ